ncbi:hypothetical protein [Rhizobium azibense]|uniref:hypothetical protein n=1 Tax=Rhizobium azibense TaxID=1136135 RepID=UPI00104EE166|nr:hypothetical protein [Rhizobium azibense]
MQIAVASMVSVIFRGASSGHAAKAGKHPRTLKPIAMLRKTKGNTIDRNLSKEREWKSKRRAMCLPCITSGVVPVLPIYCAQCSKSVQGCSLSNELSACRWTQKNRRRRRASSTVPAGHRHSCGIWKDAQFLPVSD